MPPRKATPGRKAAGIHTARKAFGATKATTAAASPKPPPTKRAAGGPRAPKLSAKNQTLFQMLQRPSGGSFTAAQARELAESQEREDRAAAKRRRSVLSGGGPSSEGMMAREASQTARRAMAPKPAPTSQVAPRAGTKIDYVRKTPKARPVRALTRSSSGSIELRGGTRGAFRQRRDRRGRFA